MFFEAVAIGCVVAAAIIGWATIKGMAVRVPKWEPGTLKEVWP